VQSYVEYLLTWHAIKMEDFCPSVVAPARPNFRKTHRLIALNLISPGSGSDVDGDIRATFRDLLGKSFLLRCGAT